MDMQQLFWLIGVTQVICVCTLVLGIVVVCGMIYKSR